jgi:DNA polymerase kappa
MTCSCFYFEIFAQYDPNFSAMSLDEAVLDVTDHIAANLPLYLDAYTSDPLQQTSQAQSVAHTPSTEVKHLPPSNQDVAGKVADDDEAVRGLRAHEDKRRKYLTSTSSKRHETDGGSMRCGPADAREVSYTNYSDDDESDKDETCSFFTEAGQKTGESLTTVEQRCRAAEACVQELRWKIFDTTELTASAGIACNRMLAKIASDMNKPNGQFLVPPTRDATVSFAQSLSVRKIGGVGKVTEKILGALQVGKVSDIYNKRYALHYAMNARQSEWFLRVALGTHSQQLSPEEQQKAIAAAEKDKSASSGRKSISKERTFATMSRTPDLVAKCHDICLALGQEMAEKQLRAKTVTVKLKSSSFEIIQKGKTLDKFISEGEDIFDAASKLLLECLPLKIRLMGIRLSFFWDPLKNSNKPKSKATFFPAVSSVASVATNAFDCGGSPMRKQQEQQTKKNESRPVFTVANFFDTHRARIADRSPSKATCSSFCNSATPNTSNNSAEHSSNIDDGKNANSSGDVVVVSSQSETEDDMLSSRIDETAEKLRKPLNATMSSLNCSRDNKDSSMQPGGDKIQSNGNGSSSASVQLQSSPMSAASEITTVVCPVCDKTYRMSNEAFNHHLDSCSGEDSAKHEIVDSGKHSSGVNSFEIKAGNPDLTEQLKTKPKGSGGTGLMQSGSTAVASALAIGCPVCGKKLEMSIQDFNAHLDSCLSMNHIAKMPSSPVASSSRPPNQRKREHAPKDGKLKAKKKNKQQNTSASISVQKYFKKENGKS